MTAVALLPDRSPRGAGCRDLRSAPPRTAPSSGWARGEDDIAVVAEVEAARLAEQKGWL